MRRPLSIPSLALSAVRSPRIAVIAAVLVAVPAISTTGVAAPSPAIGPSADATVQASSDEILGDVVTLFERDNLTATVRDAAFAAARQAGAGYGTGRGFTAMVSAIRRGSTVVRQAQAAGWAFPMAVTAFPLDVVRGLMGRDMAASLGGGVVMGAASAAFHGVQVGDTIQFGIGPFVTFPVVRIAPDTEVGGTEILMSVPQAETIGGLYDTRVVIFPPFDRAVLIDALTRAQLIGSTTVRVRTSWDAPNPDDPLSLIETKQALGEFDIDYAHLTDTGWTSIDSKWVAANLPSTREWYPAGISTRCHYGIQAGLRAALDEVVATHPELVNSRPTGIDVANTNAYGGCTIGLARFSRFGASVGTISRHSWGMAIDMSTVDNCQGCVPQMSCAIVQIFRKYGFSWGGNYLRPDGMHVEWVGQRRDNLDYPSTYCRNVVAVASAAQSPTDTRADLFADDGFTVE